MTNNLAVIIPAYRGKFLREALESFSMQTNKDFNLYVVDDASPENLDCIVDEFKTKLLIKYIKYNENFGNKSLTSQWKRAIGCSSTEQWIWLFCDDDKCDPDCVRSFQEKVNYLVTNGIQVFRFATKVIDENSIVISKLNYHPDLESGTDFFVRRIRGTMRSSLSEYIFHRNAYDQHSFQPFPLAWHSDDAAWIAFSHGNMIKTCNESVVYFRLSKDSISGSANQYKLKVVATKMFIEWVLDTDFIQTEKVSSQTWLYTYYTIETYYVHRLVSFGLKDLIMLWKLRVKCTGFWEALKIVKLARLFFM